MWRVLSCGCGCRGPGLKAIFFSFFSFAGMAAVEKFGLRPLGSCGR